MGSTCLYLFLTANQLEQGETDVELFGLFFIDMCSYRKGVHFLRKIFVELKTTNNSDQHQTYVLKKVWEYSTPDSTLAQLLLLRILYTFVK